MRFVGGGEVPVAGVALGAGRCGKARESEAEVRGRAGGIEGTGVRQSGSVVAGGVGEGLVRIDMCTWLVRDTTIVNDRGRVHHQRSSHIITYHHISSVISIH